jgi:hypothetical protein
MSIQTQARRLQINIEVKLGLASEIDPSILDRYHHTRQESTDPNTINKLAFHEEVEYWELPSRVSMNHTEVLDYQAPDIPSLLQVGYADEKKHSKREQEQGKASELTIRINGDHSLVMSHQPSHISSDKAQGEKIRSLLEVKNAGKKQGDEQERQQSNSSTITNRNSGNIDQVITDRQFQNHIGVEAVAINQWRI